MFDGQFYPFQPIQFMDGLLFPPMGRADAALIDRTTGTAIGNMNTSGGLAAAFDGNTNQARTACAEIQDATEGYIGKTFAVPTALESVTVYGSNNTGYIRNSNPSVTINLYGKTGAAPGSATDGTLLGTLTFTDTSNESGNPRQVNSSNTTTYWDHGWVRIINDTAGIDEVSCAELLMTGWIT